MGCKGSQLSLLSFTACQAVVITAASAMATMSLSIFLADHIVVPGVYADKTVRNRKRRWRLKRMEGLPHMDTESCNNEYVGFMEDIEEDPAMRQFINIYKDNTRNMPIDEDDDQDTGAPQVTLAEMLDDLDIGDMDTADADGDEDLE